MRGIEQFSIYEFLLLDRIYSIYSSLQSTKMFYQIQQQSDCDTDEQRFQKFRGGVLPANQIITKQYEPDKTAGLKLIVVPEPQQSMNSLDKNAQEQSTKFSYKGDFSDEQSLGSYSSQKIKQNLVYIKFDNRNYFCSPQNKCKYLAGFFLPLNQLIKPEVKLNKNLYNTIKQSPNFPNVNYNQHIDQSFQQNCLSAQNELKFSSNYESSNLFMAFKTRINEYELILQNDINSRGTTQWFNFTVQFPQTGIYKFNIINMTKSHSLFQKGMKIPLFSYHNYITHNRNWVRGCDNISYQKNAINREGTTESSYYTLHFEYDNQHPSDTVIFSYGYPYSGVDLERFFSKITQRKLSNNMIVEKTQISETLGGLPVWAYHIYPKKAISSLHNLHRNHSTFPQANPQKSTIQQPKSIVFMARQHPGQSQSSFILEGIVQFLLQNNEYDNSKRSFHFYILPMVNIDGVFYGNYRTNLSGNDLNRVWRQPRKDFHPEIYAVKKYLFTVNRITEIKLIIDIHGHSSAMNSFFYGNPTKKQGIQSQNPKLLPYFCSKQMKEISFLQSTFSISEDKKNSARVVLSEMFPKASVYTLENSFFGYQKGKKIVEFTIQKYKKLGRSLIASYFEYCKITERIPLIKQKWENQIQAIQSNLKISSDKQIEKDSDSEASQELLSFENEFQNIDKLNGDAEKQKQNQRHASQKRTIFGQKMQNIHQRLYEKKKLKYLINIGNQEKRKHALTGLHLHDSMNSTALNLAQLGFLSIVKIETKESLAQKRGKSSNLLVSFQREEKYPPLKETKQNQRQQTEANYNQIKPTNLMPKAEQFFKKEYAVRSVKQQNSMLRERAEVRYVNEKEFLIKRRRSLNKSSNFPPDQTGCGDPIVESVQKGSITHSKSTNILLNIRKHTGKKNSQVSTVSEQKGEENKN